MAGAGGVVAMSLAGAVVGLAPLPWLIGAGAVAGLLAVLTTPVLAVAAAALAVPFGSLVGIRIGPGTATVAPLVLAAGAAAMLWRRAPGVALWGGASRRFQAVVFSVIAYLGIVTLAGVAAPDYAAAAIEGARWVELVLAMTLAYAVGQAPSRVTAAALLLAGTAGAAVGLAQGVAGAGPEAFGILGGRLARAYGSFGQPNPFGGYMNMVWPLGAAFAITGVVGRTTLFPSSGRDRVPGWLTGIACIAAAAAIGGLVLSWSRGAWLGAAAAAATMAAVMTLKVARRPMPARVGAGVAFGFAVVIAAASAPAVAPQLGAGGLSSGAVDRLGSIATTFAAWNVADAEITDANYATIERVAHWEAAYAMWSDQPWLGQGPGQYEPAYGRFRLPQWSAPLGHAHNIYLQALAETGLWGLAAYILMVLTAIVFAALLAWERAGTFAGAAGLGLLGLLVAMAVHGLVDNLHVHDMTVSLGLALGLAGAAESALPGSLPSVANAPAPS